MSEVSDVTTILRELGELHARKENDYSGPRAHLHNYRRAEALGVPPWKSVMARVLEKVGRVETYAAGGELTNESILDALNDIALTTVIARVLLEEELNATINASPPQ